MCELADCDQPACKTLRSSPPSINDGTPVSMTVPRTSLPSESIRTTTSSGPTAKNLRNESSIKFTVPPAEVVSRLPGSTILNGDEGNFTMIIVKEIVLSLLIAISAVTTSDLIVQAWRTFGWNW